MSATVGETITLTGRAPGSASTQWCQMSGPGILNFANAGNLSTTVTTTSPGDYRVRLIADDGTIGTFQELTLTFAEALPPAAPPDVRLHDVGRAIYEISTDLTSVTHQFSGRAHETVVFAYAEDIGVPFRDHTEGGYAPRIQADDRGIYELTITEHGNHEARWNRRMFFRARRPDDVP